MTARAGWIDPREQTPERDEHGNALWVQVSVGPGHPTMPGKYLALAAPWNPPGFDWLVLWQGGDEDYIDDVVAWKPMEELTASATSPDASQSSD